MRKPEYVPTIQDRFMARAAAVASHLSVRIRPVGAFMLGNDERLARVPYSVIDISRVPMDAWAHYDGDPDGTKLPIPRKYRQVTRTQIDSDAFNELHDGNTETRPAIAWRLGDVAVAAMLSDEQAEGVLADGYYDTLLGGGPNATTIGVVDVATNSLRAIPGAATPGQVMKLRADYPGDLPVYPADGIIY